VRKTTAGALRLGALRLDEPHGRSLRRLADRLGIGHVVLLPLHERLHVGGRDEPRLVAQGGELAGPVMGAGAGFHRDHATGLSGEEAQQLVSSEDNGAGRIGPMRLEHRLRQIQADRANF
jgi:hypothetical protein